MIMLYATWCHSETKKMCHIAHVLHGRRLASIFSLYFWNFKSGLGMHYFCCMSILLFLQLDIYSKEKECSAAEDITWAIQSWKYWKRRKSFWWSTAKRRKATGWKRRTWRNNLVDLPPTESWNLSLPSHCRSLLHKIKNLFFVEDNHETINELHETLSNVRKKFKSVARKENCIILEPTGKNSNLKRKIPNMSLYNLPETERRKKP